MPSLMQAEERAARRTLSDGTWLVVGLGLIGASLIMFFNNVQISGGSWGYFGWGGMREFGWSLLPLLFGITWIVVQPRNLGGWALAIVGVAIIFLEVLGSLHFYFRPLSLITVLIMLVPGAVGISLVIKNL